MAKIKELFLPYNIPVRYSGVILDTNSEIDSNEYEWGPNPSSDVSSKKNDEEQAVVRVEDTLFTKQRINWKEDKKKSEFRGKKHMQDNKEKRMRKIKK